MDMTRTLILMLLMPTIAAALPDAPKPKVVDKKFMAVMSILAVAKTADALTTERALNHGCIETNPIFGSRPSPMRAATMHGAYFAGEAAMAYAIKRLGRRHWWGRLWVVEPAWQIQDHARLSVRNLGCEAR